MIKAGLSALLVMRPENRRYLSGYAAHDPQLDESSGCLFITKTTQYLLTDFRYQIQATSEAKGYDIVIYTSGPADELFKLCRMNRVGTIGFEEDILTVQQHRILKNKLDTRRLVPSPPLVEFLRQRKDPSEIRTMTKALRITEAAFAETAAFIKPGKTEIELARFFYDAVLRHGGEGLAFDTIAASGPNAALPHAEPTNRRIRTGETIIFDCGAKYKGYSADMTRTIILGKPKPWVKEIYRIVREAQLLALKGMRPGMRTDDADALARDHIEKAGYGPQFGHSLGHGVGLATHEGPRLSRLRPVELEPGMVVTVEPGIYLEGRGGVRLENMALVTPKGVRSLNREKTFYNWD
jgi:Xaa-Pro aminopeptidase